MLGDVGEPHLVESLGPELALHVIVVHCRAGPFARPSSPLRGRDDAVLVTEAVHASFAHAVAGLVQPDSGLFPIVHWQTVAIARWLRLREADPTRAAAFWQTVVSSPDRRWTQARVKDSTRHWFEVSHTVYLRALQRVLGELESAR